MAMRMRMVSSMMNGDGNRDAADAADDELSQSMCC